MTSTTNIFEQIPDHLPAEVVQTLATSRHVRIERILSHGQASPLGFWYDQEQAEFVIVLQGAARLRIEADDRLVTLCVGDYLVISPHQRHRVEWTTPEEPTVWLAVFYD